MANTNTSLLNYEERAVALIDVLGFTNLVVASEADPNALSKISDLIGIDKLFDQFMTQAQLGEATFFSDTFVISMTPPDRMFFLVREVGYLCRYLLLHGFPCRGAITVGPLYHHQQTIAGPAFVGAYELERSAAIYPRVLLDDTAIEYWNMEFASPCRHSHLEGLVKRDRDGLHFIDIFNVEWGRNFVQWKELVPLFKSIPNDANDYRREAKKKIQEGLIAHSDNLKTRAKYEWLAAESA